MLYDILLKTCRSDADKSAVICGEVRYDYARFKDRVDRLSSVLGSLGVQKGDRIAIAHKNCHRFLETYFAAARIGAVLVPMNIRLSSQDFVHILNDSQVKILIAQPSILPSLSTGDPLLPFLKTRIYTEPGEIEGSSEDHLDYESLLQAADLTEHVGDICEDRDIAHIYYTSGTTGRPKGVILTHGNNREHAVRSVDELGLLSSDRWLHVSPMFHLADAWAVWSITLAAGTHVVIPGFEPGLVLKAIADHRVTLSNFIPTMLNVLVNFPGVAEADFSSLRLILSGGAPIAKEVVRKVLETCGCDYVQTYGMTETAPFLTMSLLNEEMRTLPFEERLEYLVTTGRPFRGVQLKVVKEDGTEVIPDDRDVGEIIVKSETVTPGYWRMPEETSKRIVDGWLHTRDLARVNCEGYVTIVDRKDDVVITGGENVYTVEVEDVLYTFPGILEAAVIGLPDSVWGESVTAVIVAKEGEELEDEEMIRFCRQRLAPFKVPKRVIRTDCLPKTSSAKVSKYLLREKYGSR
ncbi:MAG: long-chain-fatty-acid--CoA ligase [Candidatus Aminicenantaceae bacterium]